MAAIPLLPLHLPHHPRLQHSHSLPFYSPTHLRISAILIPKLHKFQNPKPPRASSANGGDNIAPKPKTRKKNTTTSSPSSSASLSSSTETATKKPKRSKKPKPQNGKIEANGATETLKMPETTIIIEDEEYDDGIDFPYEDPPLVCCFGAVRKEFVPNVRVSEYQMHPDIYSGWKELQWDPPDFNRAPGGPASNVAISHVRLGGRAAFMGKVGDDEFGHEMVYQMNTERVQTRAVKFDDNAKTACAYMRIRFDDGKMKAETVKGSAEDSFLSSELDLAVLKEARMLHFTSDILMSPSTRPALYKAISWSKKFGGLIFFDMNLPLPLWKSRDETRELINKAWEQADIIEVSKQELEFLLDDDYHERRKNYRPQYYCEKYEQTKENKYDCYHYTREEISSLWHDKLKFLFVTHGTLRLHYYTPSFDGEVIGLEEVLITPFTCDRTGSGDAIVAAIMRKLTTHPEMFVNQDVLVRQLRFAVCAGIISQWTIGAVRSFPTESAAQNLKEQMYVPSMW